MSLIDSLRSRYDRSDMLGNCLGLMVNIEKVRYDEGSVRSEAVLI